MNTRFTPIVPSCPEPRKPATHVLTSVLEPARVQPDHDGMDDTGAYSQKLAASTPITFCELQALGWFD